MKDYKVIILIALIFLLILSGMAVTEIWSPSLFSSNDYLKVAGSFFVITLATFIINFVMVMNKKPDKDDENDA